MKAEIYAKSQLVFICLTLKNFSDLKEEEIFFRLIKYSRT